MRKIILLLISLILLFSFFFVSPNKEENKKIKVAEVTHSIFYTPQYVSLSEGFFKEENIDIELILTPGADKVASSILSGDVDIGLCGPEATIYIYQSGEKDYLQTFAQLTKKDGSFIVSREKIDNFKVSDLIGKTVIAGRSGGMPEMTFEWALKENGININDVNIDTSISFSAMDGTFIGGNGDFVTLFEPNATNIEKKGFGYIVASVGNLGGEAPYTAYIARKSFISENKDIINGFRNAINKGLKFVRDNDALTIAKSIKTYFPDMSLDELSTSIDNYKKQDSWNYDTTLKEESFLHLEEIMTSAGVLDENVSFNDLVVNE